MPGIPAKMFIFNHSLYPNIMVGLSGNFTFRYGLFVVLFLLSFPLEGQEKDTIRIAFDQILFLSDTTYFGVNDSLIVLEKTADYQLIKNFLLRKPAFYKKNPDKIESAKRLTNTYGRMLIGQIYNKQKELPEEFNPADNYYSIYQGRVVKSIQIEQVPVLYGNVLDTTKAGMSAGGRFLNSTYSPTKEWVIRNNLKFSENEPVNPRIFSDNERLLRRLSYIEDAKIQIIPMENSLDSVTVLVVVKDRYPIGVGGKINDYNSFEVEPYSRNFLGMGHNIGGIFEYDGSTDDKFGYGAYYGINNMGGTFIDGKVSLNKGLDQNLFQVKLTKTFVTTYTRFGGESIFEKLREKVKERPFIIDSVFSPDEKYSLNLLDIWMGYSFLFPHNNKHPFLNLAGRFHFENFTDLPEEDIEINYPFHDNQMYLASLSYQQVSYVKTTKLLQYGTIEDVPVGINTSLTGGWQHTSYVDRPYFGAMLNYAFYFQNTGIFYTKAEFGAFQYNSDFEDVVSVLKLAYASPLSQVKNFELRNLFQITYNSVINPRYLIPVIYSDYLMVREGLDGFYGNKNFVVNYHPVFYTKYNLWGFRFSIDPFIDFGWLNRAIYDENNWDAYSKLGINLSTKNESLIFPAMHVQFAYYMNGISDEPRFQFKLVFKDLKLFQDFTELKPRIAIPER